MILAVALFMEQMDSTVIATSLPAIAADLGTSPIALKLAVTTYLVALAIFIPISGWMADKFGAKRIFRIAILIFMAGSVACAYSDSILTFVVSRFIQGLGGSMMTPVGRLLLVRGTPRSELISAMAWLSIPGLIGPALGPPVGGFITTFFSWHWIFFINIPIGLIGIALVTKFLPDVPSQTPRPMDFTGFFLCAACFSGLVFGLSVISLPALPLAYGYVAALAGLAAGAAYLRHAARAEHPLLDPRMMRHPAFRASVLGASNFRIGLGAMPFLLPLMLQLGFGMTPFQSGMITCASTIGVIMARFFAQAIYRAYGFRPVLVTAVGTSTVLLAANGLWTPATQTALIVGCLLVGGALRSLALAGVNAMSYSDIEDTEASQATSINSVAQQISAALGIAIAGASLDLSSSRHGGELHLIDFHIAFFVVAAISGLSIVTFARLPSDAGHALTHRA
jgi:EmrB/QacA subfamily drug resistance transporter